MNPRVRSLYKQLLYMGKEYPAESGGYAKFLKMLKSLFRHASVNTPQELEQAMEKGEYMTKAPRDTNDRVGKSLLPQAIQAPQEELWLIQELRLIQGLWLIQNRNVIDYVVTASLCTDPQDEVHHHCDQKEDTQHRRAESVVVWARASHSDGLGPPVVGDQCVRHGQHGDKGEEAGADTAHLVTKVQQTHTKRAQDHGEVQPRQERPLVGEEHFGFHPGGQRNSFAGGHDKKWCWSYRAR